MLRRNTDQIEKINYLENELLKSKNIKKLKSLNLFHVEQNIRHSTSKDISFTKF